MCADCYDPPQFFTPIFPFEPITVHHAVPIVRHVPTPVQSPVQLQFLPAPPVPSPEPDVVMEDTKPTSPQPAKWQPYPSGYTSPEGGHKPASHEQILEWLHDDPHTICIGGEPPVKAGSTRPVSPNSPQSASKRYKTSSREWTPAPLPTSPEPSQTSSRSSRQRHPVILLSRQSPQQPALTPFDLTPLCVPVDSRLDQPPPLKLPPLKISVQRVLHPLKNTMNHPAIYLSLPPLMHREDGPASLPSKGSKPKWTSLSPRIISMS